MIRLRASASAFVVCLMTGLVSIVGLVNDAGAVLLSYCEIADDAQNAARVAAQQVSGIRAGTPRIVTSRAHDAALEYLRHEGHSGTVAVATSRVTVSVTTRPRMMFLPVFGIKQPIVSVERSAELVEG